MEWAKTGRNSDLEAGANSHQASGEEGREGAERRGARVGGGVTPERSLTGGAGSGAAPPPIQCPQHPGLRFRRIPYESFTLDS